MVFTLGVLFAVIGTIVLMLRADRAVATFLVASVAFPLTPILIGSVDLTLPRFLLLPLFANLIFRQGLLRTFRWQWMDTWVVLYFLGRLLALTANVPPNIFIIREFGSTLCYMVIPYFAFRLAIRTRQDILTVLEYFLIASIPLAILSGYEWFTGTSPYDILTGPRTRITRMGHYRAMGSMSVYISWGLMFALFIPLAASFWKAERFGTPLIITAIVAALVGVFTSMSSAPYFAAATAIGFLVMYPLRHHWPILTGLLVAACLFVEVSSNRHFYEVPTRFAMNSATAYYRIGLINETFDGGMDNHWLLGYGYVGIGPGNDNSNFHWRHKDMTNLYIGILVRVGLAGLIPFLVINFLYYRLLYIGARVAAHEKDEWMIWCIAAALVGWNVAMMTVGAIEQCSTILFAFAAICTNLPAAMRMESPKAEIPVQRPTSATIEWQASVPPDSDRTIADTRQTKGAAPDFQDLRGNMFEYEQYVESTLRKSRKK